MAVVDGGVLQQQLESTLAASARIRNPSHCHSLPSPAFIVTSSSSSHLHSPTGSPSHPRPLAFVPLILHSRPRRAPLPHSHPIHRIHLLICRAAAAAAAMRLSSCISSYQRTPRHTRWCIIRESCSCSVLCFGGIMVASGHWDTCEGGQGKMEK